MLLRKPIGTPVVWGGSVWQWCALIDDAVPGWSWHNLELVKRSVAGAEQWASGPVRATSEVWDGWDTWLDTDGGAGISNIHDLGADDPKSLLPPGSLEATSVLVGDLLVVDSWFGVLIAYNLSTRSEAWRVDGGSRSEVSLYRLLAATPDRLVCVRLRQVLADCTIYELPPLGWDNFPEAWDAATTSPNIVQDLATGYSRQLQLCSVTLTGAPLEGAYTWPSADEACGHASWEEQVAISDPDGTWEEVVQNLGAGPMRFSENYLRYWGRELGEQQIPERPVGVFEVVTGGTISLYSGVTEPGTLVYTGDFAGRWWHQGQSRGIYNTQWSPRRWVRAEGVTSNPTLQDYIDDVADEVATWESTFFPGYTDLQLEQVASWGEIGAWGPWQRGGIPGASLGGEVGYSVTTGTSTLYRLQQIPSEPAKIKGADVRQGWHPRYCAVTAEALVCGPAVRYLYDEPAVTCFDLTDWSQRWTWTWTGESEPRSVVGASVPVIAGPHVVLLVAAWGLEAEAPALVVLSLETGELVRAIDLPTQPTEDDLRHQIIVTDTAILYRLGGELCAVELGY